MWHKWSTRCKTMIKWSFCDFFRFWYYNNGTFLHFRDLLRSLLTCHICPYFAVHCTLAMPVEMVASETLLCIFHNEGKGELRRTILDIALIVCIIRWQCSHMDTCNVSFIYDYYWFIRDGTHGIWGLLPSMYL